MKKIWIVVLVIILGSCVDSNQAGITDGEMNEITSSDTYKNYVKAYNDYASCKLERPQLTTDFMDDKLTQEEFAAALERNGKACNIKKEIFNKYYQLLEAQFEKAAEAHRIMEE